MAAYRVYALDPDGIVVRAQLLEAKADGEAIKMASELGWPRWQLWKSTRMVADSIGRDLMDQPIDPMLV